MVRNYDPFREMERLLGNVTTRTSTAMPMDLYRAGEAFVAEIDLPGVDPDSIDIDIDERTLTVRAERKTRADAGADTKWLVRERPSGTFARQLSLGSGLANDRINAEYADGVLVLTIPVAEEAKPRKVSVQHKAQSQQLNAGDDTVLSGEATSDAEA